MAPFYGVEARAVEAEMFAVRDELAACCGAGDWGEVEGLVDLYLSLSRRFDELLYGGGA